LPIKDNPAHIDAQGVDMFKNDGAGPGTGTRGVQAQQASCAFRVETESQDFLAVIIESLEDAIVCVNPEGIIVTWNRAARHLYGLLASDVLGKPLTMSTLPEELEGVLQTIDAIRSGKEGQAFESVRVHIDGQHLDLAVVVSPIQDAGGELMGVSAIARDITESKQMGVALRENESELRALMESIPQIVWVTLPDGWHIHYNQRWLDYTGLTLEESLGHGWNPPFHPDDRARAARRWQQATDTGEAYEVEYRLRRADGIYRWMLGRALPLRDATGTIVKWFGTCTDIHDLKQAEEALRESQERFRSTFEFAAIGMAVVGLEGRWLEVNSALCEITGYSDQELMRLTFQDITHPDDLERDLMYVQQLLAGDIRSYQMEKRYLHRQGHTIWVLLSVSLVHDETGAPHYFISQVQDISERVRAEEALRRQSVRDPLTDLYNRRYLDAALEREGHRALRQGTSVGVMMLDIDHFKRFNDTYGHRAGDAILRAIGSVLQRLTRGEDITCRYGGEEFCVVLPGTGREVLRERAELIRLAIKRISLPEHGCEHGVTCSVGVAVFPGAGATITAAIDAADQALYAAKRAGRDQVVLA
jgi:diguanylate cyclase (GGDEF)-like protein/PAS domain S-box-containing protein